MRIALTGLSGSGKSTLADALAKDFGFRSICCDDRIEARLASELAAVARGIGGVAAWMGQPYEAHFARSAALYLQAEREVLEEILKELDRDATPVVIDTTGSFVYLPEALCLELRKRVRIVFLQVPEADIALLFEQYKSDPKPVIWGESYRPRPGETREQSLQRCYRDLVRYRTELYSRYADLVFPVSMRNRADADPAAFVEFLRQKGI